MESDWVNDHKILVDENKKPSKWKIFRQFAENRKTQLIFIFILISLIVPVTFYYFANDFKGFPEDTGHTCAVHDSYRVPCGGVNISESSCISLLCCYDADTNLCYHYAPSYYVYVPSENDVNSFEPSQNLTPWKTWNLEALKLDIEEIDSNTVKISLHDSSTKKITKQLVEEKEYQVNPLEDILGVEIYRTDGSMLLTTAKGPLIASDHYWEWTIHLSTEHLFGLGEISLRTNDSLTKVIYNNEKDHYSQPIFMAYQKEKYHGLRVEHDGPLEVTILPSNLIILKSLAGNRIILNLYTGPNIKDVMSQLRGSKTFMQYDYWILGTHLCRSNPMDLNTAIGQLKKDLEKPKLPYDSNCIHEHLLLMLMLNPEPAELLDLKEQLGQLKISKKFILSIPPQVPIQSELYEDAKGLDILFKNQSNEIWQGKYFNYDVAYIDFTTTNVNQWLKKLIDLINTNLININLIDAFTLIDNWPVEDTYKMDDNDEFPYLNDVISSAMSKTIPWNLPTKSSEHIIEHNKYSLQQLEAIKEAFSSSGLVIDETPILTSSYQYEMDIPVVLRSVDLTWENFGKSIKTNLYHSIFTNPLISSPVCGSNYLTNAKEEEICIKWYMAAATLPMLRVSSLWGEPIDDYFTNFGKQQAEKSLELRKQLSYYYYYYLRKNEPIVRPMFYHYPNDNETFIVDQQYMVGDYLIAAHPVTSHPNKLRIYLPPNEVWYEFWGGLPYKNVGWNSIFIIESDIVLFLKERSIIAMRMETTDLKYTHKLIIGLHEEELVAEGFIQFETSTIELSSTDDSLKITGLIALQEELGCISNLDLIFTFDFIKYPDNRQIQSKDLEICKEDNDEVIINYDYIL